MHITITKAQMRHMEDCQAALQNSSLGQVYFASPEKARAAITEGITKEELFVALDETSA